MNGRSTVKNPQNFFLNLKQSCGIQDQIRTVVYNDEETNDETEINNHICPFFQLNNHYHFLMLI